MPDMVNHPPHYTQGPVHDVCGEPVECITITESMNFNVGNAVKYLWRHGSKGSALQDLEKARWYVSREIDRLKYEQARASEKAPDDHAHESVPYSYELYGVPSGFQW